jgi:hypothetical protein
MVSAAQALPPGIEKKIENGGTLPPGIEKKIENGSTIPIGSQTPIVAPAVPEPGAAFLFGTGLLTTASMLRRRIR